MTHMSMIVEVNVAIMTLGWPKRISLHLDCVTVEQVVVFDSSIPVQLAFYALVEHGKCSPPFVDIFIPRHSHVQGILARACLLAC